MVEHHLNFAKFTIIYFNFPFISANYIIFYQARQNSIRFYVPLLTTQPWVSSLTRLQHSIGCISLSLYKDFDIMFIRIIIWYNIAFSFIQQLLCTIFCINRILIPLKEYLKIQPLYFYITIVKEVLAGINTFTKNFRFHYKI